jgi:O-Antigen ligase
MSVGSRAANGALVLLPGALTVYLSFNGGGFFPNTDAFVAVVLAGALIARISLAEAPFAGFSKRLAVAAAAFALFAGWTLLSGLWSHAPGRALVEFDRSLLYLLALLLFGSMPRSRARLRAMVWSFALGIVVVGVAGLVTRVLPDLWPTSETIAENRLSYPLTYWNSLGLLCAIGVLTCFHLTSRRTEPRVVRVLAAGAIPLLASTVIFTFSRGAIVAGFVGLIAYMLIARPRAIASGLLATVVPAALAVIAAYRADLLASLHPTAPAAVAQGHRVAVVVAASALGAAGLRALLLMVDAQLDYHRLPRRTRRRVALSATAAGAVLVVTLSVALDAPARVAHQYDRFVRSGNAGNYVDVRSRLVDPANNGRLDEWHVALDGFASAPAFGHGAGTYQTLWAKQRPIDLSVRDAHSLYVEVLDELGIVGFALLVAALITILGVFAVRARGPDRTLYAALFAAALVWALHAGIDWDWEMPAITIWLFALGGAALATSHPAKAFRGTPHMAVRSVAAVGCFAVAILPGLVMASENRLDQSANAFGHDDCNSAVHAANEARSLLGQRPQPYEIIAYCRLRQGRERDGVLELQQAVERDPENWEYRYGLAVALGATGLDPRPEARAALALNPRDPEAKDAVRRFATNHVVIWKRQARSLLRGASPFYLSDR